MRRGDRYAIHLSVAFMVLTFLTLGLFIGARFIKDAALYFVFLNIVTALYGLLGIGAVVALYKYFDFVGIALMVAYVVLSFGQLHFLPIRLYHKLHCILFWLCIAYLIYYLIRFFISKRNNVEF
ncbi:MAG: hypothetical protein IJX97_01810 [Clostridia bacterium]|nr:hypothetical protein [Clostridia bacterium]